VFLFVLYALTVWWFVYQFRGRWPAFAILAVTVPAVVVVIRAAQMMLEPGAGLTWTALDWSVLIGGSGGHAPGSAAPFVALMVWVYEALVLAIGLLIAVQPRRWAPNSCRHCRYDLAGNVSGICPECGNAVVPVKVTVASA